MRFLLFSLTLFLVRSSIALQFGAPCKAALSMRPAHGEELRPNPYENPPFQLKLDKACYNEGDMVQG